ncbi:hypothetical protein C7457_0110 [Thermovibrio guaymasensis]|uniref:Uncharacterized protein n=1 Tax=Thermovibrio guaymasensis TaxID=240167 RepID=A0A420W7F7_9BACT|nr:tetratricopeptide repeat protein [Thermovibrio guaymasensis]RKQ63247.1 hypothetical protein C7457_0110 [Thermovibrio guaymasensis]
MRWLVFFIFLFISTSSFGGYEVDKDWKIYQKGLRQYRIGSYSTALNYFLELLKPDSKYYKDALLMLSKTYYAIGKKTGLKKYLWQALNYLQLYFIEVGEGELPWDYYYTKARIYEALSFYEQALAVYRVAFLKAKSKEEKVKTTVGIIRTAVWVRRPDIVEEYFILISTERNLTKEEEKEITFIKGLALFSQGKYQEAFPYFFKLYKEYEDYLIDNPSYYLLVAENIYRLGKYTVAEHLFRRIISFTKDKEVIRRAILRLGDIEVKRGNDKLAFVYYYSVIRDYPDSLEAVVARLKIIPMMEKPEIKYRALLTKDKAFKDPIKYIATVLVNFRTTYAGIYALADLGYLVFKLDSPEMPFKRLTWEVSLIFPEEVKYEQREFIRYLWEPYLLKLPSDRGCSLYRSNPRFFQELFGRKVLLKFASDLKHCNMRRLRIELLSFILRKWKDDDSKVMMARALFETRDFSEALKVLETVKDKNRCDYLILKSELGIFLSLDLKSFNKLITKCKKDSLEIPSIAIYYLSEIGKIELAFKEFVSYKKALVNEYEKELVVKAALNKLVEKSILEDKYRVAYEVSKALYERGYRNCLIGSYLLISAVRLGKLSEAKKVYTTIDGCIDSMASLSKTVYQDTLLEEELKDGALSSTEAN